MQTSRSIVLLGPQRHQPIVREALAPLTEHSAPVAAITAGWEEREAEDLELGAHLSRPVENLQLFRRAEEVFQRDPELLRAVRAHHDDLRELQRFYRMRLRHSMPAASELLGTEGDGRLLDPEREAAFASLRALDEHHLGRVIELQQAFSAKWGLRDREHVARNREELGALLRGVGALCIAGGHVGVLFNRLWMFDVLALLPEQTPVVAWSAGAMALCERIVLFHDDPPEGQGGAELLGPGLGVCRGIVPLPHARQRLKLQDALRVQMLSRRCPDALCVALEAGDRVTWDGTAWHASASVQRLCVDGSLAALGGAA
ncbi:MAG: hypothetical protein KDC87_12945 [Planctomycetes bacterium]|nr:hypothetical protein [Planctomycetota bacterium]MCB9869205.1 hypothetical protein [Planctomycetota bacterium]